MGLMQIITERAFILNRAGSLPYASWINGQGNVMSGAAMRRAKVAHEIALRDYGEKVEEAHGEYQQLVDSGEVRPPNRLERLIEKARGHEDREDTQAARRLLAKKGVAWQ